MWLLIEGDSYSRAAFIDFRPILDSVIHKNFSTEDWFTEPILQVIDIWSSKKLPRYSRTKPRLSSAMVWPQMSELERSTCDRGHTHLIEFVHACGYYLRVATISFAELQVWLLFEGGYYLGYGFYSNKYDIFVTMYKYITVDP